jgi:hypothetical protein
MSHPGNNEENEASDKAFVRGLLYNASIIPQLCEGTPPNQEGPRNRPQEKTTSWRKRQRREQKTPDYCWGMLIRTDIGHIWSLR